MADDNADIGWQAIAEDADRRVVQLEKDVADLERAVARQADSARRWQLLAERRADDLAVRAFERGRLERLQAVIHSCPRCSVRMATPGPIEEEGTETPNGT